MIVVTPTFHFDGRHFNKLKKTAAANCSLFYKCVYALCVVLLLHFALRISLCATIALYIMLLLSCALCLVLFALCVIVDSALCCSCNSELDKLGLRRYDVASRVRTLWANEHLRKPERVRVSQTEREWQWQSEPEIEPEWVSCREKLNYSTFCHKYAVYALWTKKEMKNLRSESTM